MSNDAVITFGNSGFVPMRPLRKRTKSCLAIDPANNVTSPMLAPLLSVATAVAGGATLVCAPVSGNEADSVRMTPEAAMIMPRTIGTHEPDVDVVWMPADEKNVEPADSDMKAPKKYVRPDR